MNMLDRTIAWIDPMRAARRQAARTFLAASGGGYEGGRRSRRALQNFMPGGGSADADLLPDLPLLRERSRDLARNTPLAAGALRTVVTNVVGTGLKLRSQVDRIVLGLDEAAADLWEQSAEREFALWAESPECDLTRTQTFVELQSLGFRATLESGDCFVFGALRERPGSPYGLKLQFIEADRVSNPNRRGDTREVAGGVAFDEDMAPLGYWVTNRHPGDRLAGALEWRLIPAFGARSGQRLALHLYDRLRPELTRGAPYLSPVIEAFKQLGRYSEAELMAAVVNACFAVVTKMETGQALGPLQRAPSTAQAGGAGDDLKRVDVDFQSGLVIDGLRPNESIESFASARPNTAFDPFVLAILRQIGVALELPYEVLVKHFTASYSAAQAALLEAWRFFRVRRAWLATKLCQPVYELWLTEAVARGRLAAPGYFADPALRKAWSGALWIGDSRGQIDPTKETDAAEKQIQMGVKTLDEATAELTGGDWERKHAQRVKEVRMRRAAGLEAASPAAPGSKPAPPDPAQNPSPDQPDQEDAA